MSIIKHVTLQKIVAHDFRYDPRIIPAKRRERYLLNHSWTVSMTTIPAFLGVVRVVTTLAAFLFSSLVRRPWWRLLSLTCRSVLFPREAAVLYSVCIITHASRFILQPFLIYWFSLQFTRYTLLKFCFCRKLPSYPVVNGILYNRYKLHLVVCLKLSYLCILDTPIVRNSLSLWSLFAALFLHFVCHGLFTCVVVKHLIM